MSILRMEGPRLQRVKRKDVLIILPYINSYRVPLLQNLGRDLGARDVGLRVAAGRPVSGDRYRNDEFELSGVELLPTHVLALGRLHLVWKRLPRSAYSADLVVLEQAVKNIETYLILLIRAVTHRKVAFWGHGHTITKPQGLILRTFQGALLRRGEWFFAYTERSADRAAALAFPRERITVLNNTFDTSELRQALKNARNHVTRKPMTALYVGGLDASKRINTLIDASKKLHSLDDSFRLIVGGDGIDAQLLESPDLPFIDYRGPMSTQMKAAAAAEASILLVPGRVGLIAIDSVVCGLPLITMSHKWHAPEAEYLSAANSVTTNDDLESFVEEAFRVLSDETVRGKLVRSLEDMSSNFDIEKMASKFAAGISEALGPEL